MGQVFRSAVVSNAKPYAIRFAKIYLIVAAIATIGWEIQFAVFTPDLLFDWFFGPIAVGTAVQWAVTSTTVTAVSVIAFAAGVAYGRYR